MHHLLPLPLSLRGQVVSDCPHGLPVIFSVFSSSPVSLYLHFPSWYLTDTFFFLVLRKSDESTGFLCRNEDSELKGALHKGVSGERVAELSFLPLVFVSHWALVSQPHAGAVGGNTVGSGLGGPQIPWLVLMMGWVFCLHSEAVLLCVAGPENQDQQPSYREEVSAAWQCEETPPR